MRRGVDVMASTCGVIKGFESELTSSLLSFFVGGSTWHCFSAHPEKVLVFGAGELSGEIMSDAGEQPLSHRVFGSSSTESPGADVLAPRA